MSAVVTTATSLTPINQQETQFSTSVSIMKDFLHLQLLNLFPVAPKGRTRISKFRRRLDTKMEVSEQRASSKYHDKR